MAPRAFGEDEPSRHVAVADASGEVVEPPDAVGADEPPGEPVRRRRGKGDADELTQMREVLAAQLERDVERAERGEVGEAAAHARGGRARPDVRDERIGRGRVGEHAAPSGRGRRR